MGINGHIWMAHSYVPLFTGGYQPSVLAIFDRESHGKAPIPGAWKQYSFEFLGVCSCWPMISESAGTPTWRIIPRIDLTGW